MNFDEPTILFYWLVGLAAGVFVYALIVRLIFSIPQSMKHQKAQTELLIKIAKANGVTEDEVDGIRQTLKHS